MGKLYDDSVADYFELSIQKTNDGRFKIEYSGNKKLIQEITQ